MKFLGWIFLGILLKPEWQHSTKWMSRFRNIATCDYQKSVTTGQTQGQTDKRQSKWSLCATMLCRKYNKLWTDRQTDRVITIGFDKLHMHVILVNSYYFLRAIRDVESFLSQPFIRTDYSSELTVPSTFWPADTFVWLASYFYFYFDKLSSTQGYFYPSFAHTLYT